MTLPSLPAQGSTTWYPWATGIHNAVASFGSGTGPNVLNVRSYGALGDGTTNDSTAIKAAEAALTSGKALLFPKGSYRFTQQSPSGGAALVISGKSNVAVIFEPGAELLMDNLDGSGNGTSHGIAVRGAGSRIALVNPKVRWASVPSARSNGDGLNILGYPSDSAPAGGWTGSTGTLTDLRITNAAVINAPQTGAVIMGCSDVAVSNFRAEGTLADGLHFNACRRVNVDGYISSGCGDDGLAFVTYHHATTLWADAAVGPFWQNGLGAWSNTDSTATGIVVTGGVADGCRIGGAKNVAIGTLVVDGKSVSGLVVDSAIANGTTILWSYVASRGISVTSLVADNCPIGLHVATQNITSADDPMWWTFDLRIADVTVRNASNWSIRTEGNGSSTSVVAGLHVANIKVTTGGSGGSVGFSALRNSYIGALVMDTTSGATVGFYGSDALYTGALASLTRNSVLVDKIDMRGGGKVLLQDFSGLLCGDIRVTDATNGGIEFVQVANAQIGNLRVVRANRANSGLSRGIYFGKVLNVDVTALVIDHDANTGGTWESIEIGGGDATDPAARGLRIEKVVYVNAINQTGNNIVQQGGSFAPVSHYARVQFYNGGEASPIWRTATVGTLPVFP